MISISLISLISFIFSVIAIILAFLIFKKVFEEQYKRPWLFIGISSIFLGLNQILVLLNSNFGLEIYNNNLTNIILYTLNFLAIVILTYGLFLEVVILRYFKGKFVKMKLMPVQEDEIGEDFNINIIRGKSYRIVNKNISKSLEEISKAIKKGFEGFVIVEKTPKEIREKYKILKSPIVWLSQVDQNLDENYLKEYLDENSENLNPLQINQLITFIDNFLTQSQNPFIFLELNLILETNNSSIVLELVKYISNKINRYRGIFIIFFDETLISSSQLNDIKEFIYDLEI